MAAESKYIVTSLTEVVEALKKKCVPHNPTQQRHAHKSIYVKETQCQDPARHRREEVDGEGE